MLSDDPNPKVMIWEYYCAIAEGNWSIGDRVQIGAVVNNVGGGSYGAATYSDATNAYFINSNSVSTPINNKTTGALLSITIANWRLIVTAWT